MVEPDVYKRQEVRCKPLFRREHLAVQHGAALMERAFDMAVEDWNLSLIHI